ncbi:MAG: hypothetical protein ACREAQ_06380, partial [Nitrososphaera sp.]
IHSCIFLAGFQTLAQRLSANRMDPRCSQTVALPDGRKKSLKATPRKLRAARLMRWHSTCLPLATIKSPQSKAMRDLKPQLSIGLPLYNGGKYLSQALNALLAGGERTLENLGVMKCAC